MEKKNKEYTETKKGNWKSIGIWLLVILIAISVVGLLWFPEMGDVWNFFIKTKGNKDIFSLSRLQFLQLCISLVGPILTFIVFQNTLEIQRENKNKYDHDKLDAENRKNIDDANREFYNLLSLFSKQQTLVNERDIFNKLYSNAIYNDSGADFINDYNYSVVPVLNHQKYIIKTNRSEGPEFDSPTPYAPKVSETNIKEESSLEIIEEQYKSVYDVLGPYFKILHRIVKNLNSRVKDGKLEEDDYYNFIGILRSQISSEEFLVILVNSLFIKRGLGLGIELVASNFFGNVRDFKVNQHFDIPTKKISTKDIKCFVEDNENLALRISLQDELEKIDSVEDYKKIANFHSFIAEKTKPIAT